jgi:hypothetical protein
MDEMGKDEIQKYQNNIPIGKRLFRYYGQVDY